MAKEKIDINYDFKATSYYEYRLSLSFSVKNRIITSIFNQSKRKLHRKGINIKGTPEEIKAFEVSKFDVDNRFLKLIHVAINKELKKIEAEVLQDKIRVMSSAIKKCFFEKENEEWNINIILEGEYVKV